MRMTTRSRYAVRALVSLWMKSDGTNPVPLSEIARDEDISLNFLEQIFMSLRQQGIVNSVRGPSGGYILNKEPDKITLAEVIRAVGEPTFPLKCVDDYIDGSQREICPRESSCQTRWAWLELGRSINEFLETFTISRILEKK
jgi:Rrf2 family protein